MVMEDKRKFLQAFDKNIKSKFSFLPSQIKQMDVKTIENMLVIDSKLPCDMFNIICCNGEVDLLSIQKSIENFKSKKMPYAFWVGFEDEPSGLEAELVKLGLITDEVEWAMVCDLNKQPFVKHDVDIRKVTDSKGVQDIIKVINRILPEHEHHAVQSFYNQSVEVLVRDDCPLTFFVAYADEKPISLSSCYCHEGLASIFDVIVLPEMRGKGLGKLMTQEAMHESLKRGFETCVLTATNDAKYLYQKLGFVDVKTMRVYHEV